jgi:hypothetical protein
MHRTILTFVLAIGLAVSATQVWAGTPDGETPSRESICDPLSGAARGICNSYCEAQDCNMHPRASCTALRRKYQKLTGSPVFPCDMLPCGYADGPECGGTCPNGGFCLYIGDNGDAPGADCTCWGPVLD